MAHQNSQHNNNPIGSNNVWNPLTPPLTGVQNNSQQQQQQMAIHSNNSSQLISSPSVSLASWSSSTSIGSTSPEVRVEDKLFDKIEDMIRDYMRESNRHYLHCRVFRWSLDEDLSRQFSAVVVINPPTTKN
jgi:hypothetical protein